MNEELRVKYNFIVSLLNQLPKQADCTANFNHNNRFSNKVIDNNKNNGTLVIKITFTLMKKN